MTVRDSPAIPFLPPASSCTPCIPQRGAVGSFMLSPSSFAPHLMETHVFQPSPSGFLLEYKGPLPGHVGIPDIDDDDDDDDDLGDHGVFRF